MTEHCPHCGKSTTVTPRPPTEPLPTAAAAVLVSLISKSELSDAYMSQAYGVCFQFGWPAMAMFDHYRSTQHTKRMPRDRYVFEGWFKHSNLLPTKLMAIKLGMNASTLRGLFKYLPQLGMAASLYQLTDAFVSTRFEDDLIESLNTLRFKPQHEKVHTRLKALHEAILSETGYRIDPVLCKTTNHPEHIADAYCSLTFQPISTSDCVWLDLGKPIALPTDRCSRIFAKQHLDTLAPHIRNRDELEQELADDCQPA